MTVEAERVRQPAGHTLTSFFLVILYSRRRGTMFSASVTVDTARFTFVWGSSPTWSRVSSIVYGPYSSASRPLVGKIWATDTLWVLM